MGVGEVRDKGGCGCMPSSRARGLSGGNRLRVRARWREKKTQSDQECKRSSRRKVVHGAGSLSRTGCCAPRRWERLQKLNSGLGYSPGRGFRSVPAGRGLRDHLETENYRTGRPGYDELFITQRDHGVGAHGAERGKVTGEDRDGEKQNRYGRKGERVGCRDPEKRTRQRTSEDQG